MHGDLPFAPRGVERRLSHSAVVHRQWEDSIGPAGEDQVPGGDRFRDVPQPAQRLPLSDKGSLGDQQQTLGGPPRDAHPVAVTRIGHPPDRTGLSPHCGNFAHHHPASEDRVAHPHLVRPPHIHQGKFTLQNQSVFVYAVAPSNGQHAA